MATTSNMFMYSLTIQQPAAITDAVVGKLVGRREGSSQREEDYLMTASGSLINLWKWDSDSNHLNLVLSHNTFSNVRALSVFRFAGSPKGMPCSFGNALRILTTSSPMSKRIAGCSCLRPFRSCGSSC